MINVYYRSQISQASLVNIYVPHFQCYIVSRESTTQVRFYGIGKTRAFKAIQRNEDFSNLFKSFGDAFLFNSELFPMVEKLICKLYAAKAKNVNEGRYSKFYGKKKTPESQELPPTVDALLYHCKRVFYATAIIKQSLQPRPQSNFKKMALATHDFAGNFHLIWFVNCKTIEINLCNVVNFS